MPSCHSLLVPLATTLASCHAENVLAPRAYAPLPTGSVTPKGWLLKQLKLQAEGLSGHLSMFWNDVMASSWVGGDGDGGLHERTPYWLNGFVPLAYLLKNAGVEELAPVSGIYKHKHHGHSHADAPTEAQVSAGDALCKNGTDSYGHDLSQTDVASVQACYDLCSQLPVCAGWVVDSCHPNPAAPITCWLKAEMTTIIASSCRCTGAKGPSVPTPAPQPVKPLEQVKKYMDYILSHVDHALGGWLGPAPGAKDANAYWGPSNAILALCMYAEAERADATLYANITKTMLNHLLNVQERIQTVPLGGWAAQRWQDLALGTHWLYENAPQGKETELLALAQAMHDQGVDWEGWFQTFTGDAGAHNVNNAQGLKSAAVWWRQNKSQELVTLSKTRMENMDKT